MSAETTTWTPVETALPAEGTEVEVITPGGDQRRLVFSSGLWWLPDRSMYVYFTPTFWRAAETTLCGQREVLASHPGGTDYSAPCVQQVGPKGVHRGPHLDRNGRSW